MAAFSRTGTALHDSSLRGVTRASTPGIGVLRKPWCGVTWFQPLMVDGSGTETIGDENHDAAGPA
jgi:hypothetical protein